MFLLLRLVFIIDRGSRNVEAALGGKVCPKLLLEGIFLSFFFPHFYRAILISESKSEMSPRVELKLLTTVSMVPH
jgi:hypothetical protein